MCREMKELAKLLVLFSCIIASLYGVTSFIEWRRLSWIAAHPHPRAKAPTMVYCTYSGAIDSTRGRFYTSAPTYEKKLSEKVSGL